jgi:hypothetical protein
VSLAERGRTNIDQVAHIVGAGGVSLPEQRIGVASANATDFARAVEFQERAGMLVWAARVHATAPESLCRLGP